MDARSVSYTTLSRRASSSIYLDLVDFHRSSSRDTSTSSHSSLMIKRFLNPTAMPHIGIVGAGVSGLRCAEVLINHGFHVTILEGRNRLGGRMHQATLPSGHSVDLGPNWIHGTDNNPILNLARETETVTHLWEDAATLFAEDGSRLPDHVSKDLSGELWGLVLEAFQESNRNTKSIPNHTSLYDWFEEKVAEKFPGVQEDAERKRKIVLQIGEMWGAFVGSPVQKQSMKFFWLEECIDGENLFVASTYQKIFSQIAKTAVEKADIKFSTKVTKVVTIPSEDEETPSCVKVVTEKGEEFRFDELVMTPPLGWLKKNKSVFEPALPERVEKAIDSISYGCLEKVYISFPTAFWNKPQAPSEPSIPAVKSVDSWLSNSSESSPSQSRSLARAVSLKDKLRQSKHSIGFTQWLSPLYAPTTNPHRWHQESVNLASLPGSTAQPTLLFYIFGDQSRELTKQLSELQSPNDKQEGDFPNAAQSALLATFFQPYYSLLPNYSSSSPDCTPTSFLYTNWLSDDLAGNGSYTNFECSPPPNANNSEEAEPCEFDKDVEALREGLHEQGLWFAGEHVAPFVALGTVTGAWWSGERVANRIFNAYGGEQRLWDGNGNDGRAIRTGDGSFGDADEEEGPFRRIKTAGSEKWECIGRDDGGVEEIRGRERETVAS